MLSVPRNGIGSTMNFVLQPWQLLLVILAGWINRQQQEVLEYLRTENQVLKESHGKKRIPLTDNQRRRLAAKGTLVKLPARSPNLNASMERFMRSLKSECLNRRIFFGEKSARRAVNEFLEHYHVERNHQGLDNSLIEPGTKVGCVDGKIACRERLGGSVAKSV
jgi:hypothetical protein